MIELTDEQQKILKLTDDQKKKLALLQSFDLTEEQQKILNLTDEQKKKLNQQKGEPPGTLFAGVFDSSHRLAIVDKSNNGQLRIISENPPDTAIKTLSDISLSGTYKGADANLRVMLARDVVQLGQRTVAVNLLRDALWRITDGSINDLEKRSLFYKVWVELMLHPCCAYRAYGTLKF